METMQNKPGLVRRNGTYYARLRVPKNLREQIGKAEIKLSLKTKDRAEANAKLSDALVSIHRIFAAALNADEAVTPDAVEVGRGVLEQIARDWFRPRWQAREHAVWQPIPPDKSVQDAIDIIDQDLAQVSSSSSTNINFILCCSANGSPFADIVPTGRGRPGVMVWSIG